MLLATFYGFCALLLLAYNLVPPPFTTVQVQRGIEQLVGSEDFHFQYHPVAMSRISPQLQHAAVAAEDGRFYQHHGVDWVAVQKAVEDNQRRGRVWRGGSTITQQLVKNLFLTTHSNIVRKALELPLAYMAEGLLSKQRILCLYLNVIEWGPGIYGAEAAARHYYGVPASKLSRRQAASLAAIIPNPLHRKPGRMGGYTNTILTRMRQMGY